MSDTTHIVGAGIGGLACAIALARAGFSVEVSERADGPSEVGAGIQLGPNATRVLAELGLLDAIKHVASSPINTVTRGIFSIKILAELALTGSGSVAERFGSPYLCVHRAELHRVLLDAAVKHGVALNWGVAWVPGDQPKEELLIAADGLWSAVRASSGDLSLPGATGHWAWRTTLALDALPQELRRECITAWFGPSQHVVTYPLKLGGTRLLNMVAFTPMDRQSRDAKPARSWALETNSPALLQALGRVHPLLEQAIRTSTKLTRWEVAARPPLKGAQDMLTQINGRTVPMIGDAAHPMRPYMAQGAAMALEDAITLAKCLAAARHEPNEAFARYAQLRWARNARVQRKAAMNGVIFHLPAPLSWARDAALAVRPKLMDVPWLFCHRT